MQNKQKKAFVEFQVNFLMSSSLYQERIARTLNNVLKEIVVRKHINPMHSKLAFNVQWKVDVQKNIISLLFKKIDFQRINTICSFLKNFFCGGGKRKET